MNLNRRQFLQMIAAVTAALPLPVMGEASKPTYLYVDEWRPTFRLQNATELDYVTPFTQSLAEALPSNFYQVVREIVEVELKKWN